MRGLLRELGIVMPQGARTALNRIPELVEDAEVEIPATMRALLFEVLGEVLGLEQRIAELERELQRHAGTEFDAKHSMPAPGVGLLTATAMVAAVLGPSLFPSESQETPGFAGEAVTVRGARGEAAMWLATA